MATADPAKRGNAGIGRHSYHSPQVGRRQSLVTGTDARLLQRAQSDYLKDLRTHLLQRRIREGATKISCDLGDTVIAVAISPNGDYFAAGGNSKAVVVYNTMTGEEVSRIPADAAITCLRFTYGPRTRAIESEDGIPTRLHIELSNASGPPKDQHAQHSDTRTSSSDNTEERRLRVVMGAQRSRTSSVGTQRRRSIFSSLPKLPLRGSLSRSSRDVEAPLPPPPPRGRERSLKLVIGTYAAGQKSNVLVADVQSRTFLANNQFGRQGQGANVQSSAISRNGSMVAVGGEAQFVFLMQLEVDPRIQLDADPASGEEPKEPLHTGALKLTIAAKVKYPSHVNAVSLNADGTLLAVAGDARRVQLWSIVRDDSSEFSPKLVYQFNCHTVVYGLDISADGRLLAAGTNKRTEVWRVRWNNPRVEQRAGRWGKSHWSTVRQATSSKQEMAAAIAAANGDVVVPPAPKKGGGGGDRGGKLRFTDVVKAAQEQTGRPTTFSTQVASQRLSQQYTYGESAMRDYLRYKRANAVHPDIECEPIQIFKEAAPQGGIAFSGDASRLAIGGEQLVTVHDVHTGATLRSFKNAGRVRCVAISTAGSEVVSGGFDKRASLMCVDAGAEIKEALSKDMDVVRCVDVQGTQMAIGGSTRTGGLAQLFDSSNDFAKPVHSWWRNKEVRCVLLSALKDLLIVSGHDCLVQLLCTKTFATLCELNFQNKPSGPPHFVWSVDLSLDCKIMAVACWSSKVHVYNLGHVRDAPQPRVVGPSLAARLFGGEEASNAPAVPKITEARRPISPTEIAVIKRGDRVYSTSLDGKGHYLFVGGRDKKAAMYDMRDTVAASESFTAGRHEPRLLWEEQADEFIYSVSLARNNTVCAFGGMGKSVRVLEAATKHLLFDVPVVGTVHSVAVQEDGAKVAVSGELPFVAVYDRAGREKLILPTSDESFSCYLSSHCLAYTKQTSGVMYGRDGITYGWQDQPSWEMATSVLRLSSDENLYRFLTNVLNDHPSLVNSRSTRDGSSFLKFMVEFSRDPEIIDVVLNASTYIGLLPDEALTTALHTAVETGNRTAMKRMLRGLLLGKLSRMPGSMRQVFSCFQLIATRYPHDFLDYIAAVELEPEPEVLNERDDSTDVTLPRMLVQGSKYRFPKGIWNSVILQHRTVSQDDIGGQLVDQETIQEMTRAEEAARATEETADEDEAAAAAGLALRDSSESLRPPRELLRKSTRQTEDGGDTRLPPRADMFAEPQLDQGMTMTKSVSSGLKAMRVPFQHFAGYGNETGGAGKGKGTGGSLSPLQLISQAARRTGDYGVFGATIVEATLQYKWESYARRQFWQELITYVIKMGAIYVHVLWGLFPPSTNGGPPELIGMPWDELVQHPRFRYVLATWLITTAFAVNDEWHEIRQMRVANTFGEYFGPWNCFDQVQIILQLSSNAIFVLASLYGDLPQDLAGFGPLTTMYTNETDDETAVRRMLKGGGGSSSSDDGCDDVEVFHDENGWVLTIVVCEALVLLCVHMKLLYYARGFKKLGVLVRMITQIMEDMVSFLLVLLVILFGFGLSLYILRRHRYAEGPSSVVDAVFDIVDAGLYADMTEDSYDDAGVVQLIVFTLFMGVTQVVLLNLLIAIMSDSYTKVRTQAELASKFEQAQVVLEEEISPPLLERVWNRVMGLGDHHKFPRWLHVLMNETDELTNDLNSRGGDTDDASKIARPAAAPPPQPLPNAASAMGTHAHTMTQRLEKLEEKVDSLIEIATLNRRRLLGHSAGASGGK